jgi:hypothetical protein
MPPEVIIVPTIFLIPAAVVTVRMWLAHREKMAGLSSGRSQAVSGELASRVARIEQAVDSIAVEVERISEGQRFVTKLLAEAPRQVPPASPPAESAHRPHSA